MAIGTTAKTITTTWQNIGPGPLFFQLTQGRLRCAIQAASPAANDPGFSVDPDHDEYTVTVVANVWVRAVTGTGRVVVSTLA